MIALGEVSKSGAQTQLIVADAFNAALKPGDVVAVDLTRGEFTWAVPWPAAGSPTGPVVATSEGRYVLWSVEDGVVVRNSSSGALFRIGPPEPPSKLLSNPTHSQVFAFYSGAFGTPARLQVIELKGARDVYPCARPVDGSFIADGSQLYVACEGQHIAVLDTRSLAVVRQIVTSEPVSSIQVSADGSRFAIAHNAHDGSERGVTLYNGESGERLISISGPLVPPGDHRPAGAILRADPTRQRLYVSYVFRGTLSIGGRFATTGETQELDFLTLALRGEVQRQFSSVYFGAMAFTPDGGRLIGTQWEAGCTVMLVDLATRAVEHAINVGVLPTACGAAITAPPLPPEKVESVLTATRVGLSWELPAHSPSAIEYAVDISLAPGGPAVVRLTSSAPFISVDPAPPGTYYVRVRAANANGISGFSLEHRLLVP